MRVIIEFFQTECRKTELHVPIQTFDGQWLKLVIRYENENPPMELKFAKDHRNKTKKTQQK